MRNIKILTNQYYNMVNKRYWFMDIKDKIPVIDERERHCPPHYIPHKLPLGEPVTDEHCHIHRNPLRMIHHNFFCEYLKCPNYNFMRREYEKSKEK